MFTDQIEIHVRSGKGGDATTSGFEGAWKPNPTTWDMGYFKVLFKYEYEQMTTAAGAIQSRNPLALGSK